MKKFIFLIACCLSFSLLSFAQQDKKEKPKLEFDKSKPVYIVDASCGTCQFKMAGKGCDLAIKYEGKYYYVDGTSIDDHGDAHDEHGFCNAVRKAEVQGTVVGDKFHVTWFAMKKEK